MQSTTQKHRLSRAAVAGLATLGLSASFLGLSLATAPGAQAVGTISSVAINEVESNGDTNDWIELYNNDGVNSVDLTGAYLQDGDPSHHLALSGTIAPHGFVTINVDDAILVGDFGLGGADSARLLDSNDDVVDEYSWTAHAATTYGRFPDGTGPFYTTTSSTKNVANDVDGPGDQPLPDTLIGVYINEVESQGDALRGNWIELYNSTGDDVVLDGAILADNNNGHTLTIPADTTIEAGAYLAFIVQDAEEEGAFGLGDVDEARLYEPGTTDLATAIPVDAYGWNTHSPVTYGRDWTDLVPGPYSEDVGAWKVTCASTFEAENDTDCGAAEDTLTGNVVINEVESDPESSPALAGDWVELYNKSATVTAHIAGAVISDSDTTHAFQIPNDTDDLAPGAYIAFRVDNPLVDGNFGLGSGDTAQLFRAGVDMTDPGTVPVSSYTWSSHAAQTWGRCPTPGTGPFVNTVAPTPGSANNCP